MTLQDLLDNPPSKEFVDVMERAAWRERYRKEYYRKNYSNVMTYDRFVFINYLDGEVMSHKIDPQHARELLNNYDEINPDGKF